MAANNDEPIKIKGRITVFSISGCPHCRRAKNHLKKKNLPYVEINLDIYPERRNEMVKITQRRTVPQVFFNEKHVGGADDLLGLDEKEFDNHVDYVLTKEANDKTPEEPKITQTDEIDFSDISCELDSYNNIVNEMRDSKKGIDIRDRFFRLRKYYTCFTGKEAVNWLVKNGHAKSRSEALELGNTLMERHFFHHVLYEHNFKDDNYFYRFLHDVKSNALNSDGIANCEPENPSEVSEKLRRLILAIYEDFLSDDGSAVDYEGLAKSEAFKRYKAKALELKRLNLSSMNRNEKIAFFINIYNALVIHANVEKGAPKNNWQRAKFFSSISYIIGGHEYSLNDIENGILRANKTPPYSFTLPFSKGDPRSIIALNYPEPRIHFALVCGAKSCPPIKTYSAKNIDEQLTSAAQSFLEGEALEINVEKRKIFLSKILDWYSSDFGKTEEDVLSWVLSFTTGKKKDQLEKLIQSKKYSLSYQKYDWGQNKKD